MARQPHNPDTKQTETATADDLGNPGPGSPLAAPPPVVQAAGQAGPLGIVKGRPLSLQGGAGGMPGNPGAETRVGGSVTGGPAMRDGTPPGTDLKSYRVVNGGYVMLDGQRQRIPMGKVVDHRMYDLKVLRQQGIQLTEVTEDDDYIVGPEAL